MSFLGDTFKFENFRLGKMWDQIKSHPQRLLFGAMMDPLSTWIENKTTGSHFTPQSDQLGGAYGGRTISAFGGGQQGGIYKEAQDAGIPTGQAAKFENAAHIAAGLAGAIYGGGALAAAGGGGAGGGAAGAGAAGAGSGATYGSLGALGGTSGGLGTYGTFGGATAAGGGLGAGSTAAAETYSPALIEATSGGGSSTPTWLKFAQGMQSGTPQQGPQMRLDDPTAEAERRRQRVLELLVQLHQSQQPPAATPGLFQ